MPRNRGKRLERLLEYVHQLYRNRGEAEIEKKQLATTLDRRTGRVVYLARAGFDFEGCILGGRNICIEAKETTDADRLPIDPEGKSGLKIHQIEALFRRHKLGAIVGVIWMTDYDSAYFIGYKVLSKFMDTIYNKPGPKGKLVKSMSLDFVKQHCPSVMSDGLVDYLRSARKEEKDERANEDVRGVANKSSGGRDAPGQTLSGPGRPLVDGKQPGQEVAHGVSNVPSQDQPQGTKVSTNPRDG